ncbi:leucine-rich repeat protein [Eggerthella timonensis]|uniref:leucine-rich repeat protein n=1 Tax=Eggerthella timonensis TaxID=1871008 RepID=UPI000C78DFF5|nr:leucine-rich repeat protein [Eggerthella timonensis]
MKLPESSDSPQAALSAEAQDKPSADSAPASPNATKNSNAQVAGDVPLASQDPKASVGDVRADGLLYRILPDGASAALVGWYGEAPKGDMQVPASVSSGEDSYDVTRIGEAGEDGRSAGVFAGSNAAFVALPSTVREVVDGALSGCLSLARIDVSPKNESFASFDGMLFSKDLTSLLTFPEGKEGVAHIPDQTETVPASAFSQAPGLLMVEVGEGNVAFRSEKGILYSKDMKTLVACPVGAGNAVVVPEGVASIAAGALAGCAVSSITALGFVRDIAADAFDAEARECAVVALPAGDDYEARKAVWVAAGFSSFKEPAKPGDVAVPEPSEPEAALASGLVYEVLDDYTLAVSWQGAEGPEGDLEIPATAEVGGVSYRVSAVADAGFAGRSGLTGVALPASVAVVGDRAFEATGISDVWLPASVATVGERAFAACASLERVVALGSPWVADSALAECSGVSVYAPSDSDNLWNVGLPAAGNHLMPYGVALSEEPLQLEVGQSAGLLEGGQLSAPDPIEASYSYAAKPLSVDADGTASGKAEGSSEVTVALAIEGVELARATRTVEVTAATEPEEELADENQRASDDRFAEDGLTPQVSQMEQLISSEPESVAEGERVSQVALLSTGDTFEQKVASGQTLKFEVLTEDEPAKTGTVSVAKSDDATLEPSGDVVIPAYVSNNGVLYEVTAVADSGFSLAWRVTSVSFEEQSSLKTVGSNAFNNVGSCRSIDLPQTVTYIGANAFSNDVSLVSVNIPDSVTTLGERTFARNLALETIQLGSGVAVIPREAFEYCTSLTELHVAGEVASIDEAAFSHVATRDVSVYVPDAASEAAWRKASSEAGYDFKDIVRQGEVCTVVFDAQGGTPARQEAVVGKGSPVRMPASPSKGGASIAGWFTDPACEEGSRWDFSSIVDSDTTLYAKWVDEVRDGDYVYRMRSDGASLSVAAVDSESLSGDIAIPATYEFGGDGIALPVKEIASCGFSLSKIETLSVPNTVEVIGNEAFRQSEKLRSVVLEQGSALSSIETNAFRECTSLAGFQFPASLEVLGNCVFEKCSSLATVEFNNDMTLSTLSTYTFRDCANLREVRLPDSLSALDYGAFLNCASLADIDLSGIEIIAYKAFAGSGLVSVVIPESVTTLEANVFEACKSLAHATVQARLSAIPAATFRLCEALVSVSLPSSVKSFGVSVFRNCPLSTIYADGSMQDADIPGVFDAADKANAFVILPEKSADGTETFEAMSSAWKGYGFVHVIASSCTLPTIDGGENARWTLDADGTLRIECTKTGAVIENLGWSETAYSDGYWAPVRSAVKRIELASGTDALDMEWWFAGMTSLGFAPDFSFPSSVESVRGLFAGCSSMTGLPDGFKLPDSVKACSHLFKDCSALASLPASFTVPAGIDDIDFGLCGMFWNCSSLKALPEGFSIPDTPGLTKMDGVFMNCNSLATLPVGFSIPDRVEKCSGTFQNCSALTSLPDGFNVPSSCKVLTYTFSGCTSLLALPEGFSVPSGANPAYAFNNCASLTRLPDSFDLPASSLADGSVFGVAGAKLPMYYSGLNGNVIGYAWDQANRTLVKPSDRPANAKTVTLNVKAEGEGGPGSYWTTAYTDGSGMLAEPVAPSRQGMVFTLWYADEACTQRVDFSQPFETDATLYGKLVPGTIGGALPTEAGTGSAFWTLADDGTLYIRGAGKVADLGWSSDLAAPPTQGYWRPWTSEVRAVAMAPSLRAVTCDHWFADMQNLTDASSACIPRDSTSFYRMFRATGIKSLPEGCTIPSGAKSTWGMFYNCRELESLPDGFKLPDSLENANSMFGHCEKLKTLPEGFSLPQGILVADWMFGSCYDLVSLPSGFVIPDGSNASVKGMFQICTSLVSLPDGFRIPESILSEGAGKQGGMYRMFYRCNALASLPASFDFPLAVASESDEAFFCDIEAGKPRVATSYAGESAAVLAYDWASQNRVLIADPADRDMREISYKLVNEDGSWSTRSTVLTGSDGMVPNVGEPQRDGYGFTGWCVDEECLVPFDFSEPVSEDRTLYGKWVKHGGRDAKLPLVAGTQGDVWWRITVDGQLCIGGEGQVGDLGFTYNQSVARVNYWDPYRDEVEDILMEPGVTVPGSTGMAAWFCWLPNLVNVDSLVIPEGTKSLLDLFYGCANLKSLNEGFGIPASVESVVGMFNSCLSLESLPQSFVFSEAGNLKSVMWMFNLCKSLKHLPAGFTIPSGVETIDHFASGSALVSLPEGFDIPTSVQAGSYAFEKAANLRVLPESLNLSKLSGRTKGTMSNAFFCDELTETFYPGDPANLNMGDGYWAKQNRTIVSAAPTGKTFVDLYLPDEAGAQKLWTREALDANSSMGEPVAPGRENSAFLGWYTDPDCTAKATFPLTLNGETSLYGKYVLSDGKLPTVRDGVPGEEASWSFHDGTLTIRCDVEGAAIDTLWSLPEDGNVNGVPRVAHWSPLRDQVTKVVIESNVRVRRDMRFWFTGMENLTDISEFRFPAGAADVTHLFAKCSNLASVPGDFTIPDYVTSLNGLFLNCAVESLPAGLTLPENVVDVASMLDGCKITSLPSGFALPPTVEKTSFMLSRTPIKELPPSFLLPDAVEKAQSMFAGCSNLTSLPDGFKIPKNMILADKMFRGCSSLAALPDGFALENPSALTDVNGMFENCSSLTTLPASLDVSGIPATCTGLDTMFKIGSGKLSTYVLGGDLAKLSVGGNDAESYWLTTYNRKLVTDPAELGGAKAVTFKTKVVGEQEWTTWQTMLTDQAGALADPQYSGRFGYAFDGWYADADCTQKYVFGKTPLPAEGVLYGTHSLIMKYDIPVKAQVTLDATGAVTPADVRIKSFTPVPLAVSRVSCTAANSSSDVMDSDDLLKVSVSITPEGAAYPVRVSPGGWTGTNQAFALPAAESGKPGELGCSIGLDIPDASKVKFWRDGWSTDLVKLEYTVEAAS